jgi:hypothetical protein
VGRHRIDWSGSVLGQSVGFCGGGGETEREREGSNRSEVALCTYTIQLLS